MSDQHVAPHVTDAHGATLPPIHVFDTQAGQRSLLVPLEAGHVRMYVCGATVYDLIHIGNARVYATFDVVARYLRHRGYRVTYCRNYTDVDDKIIRRANQNGEAAQALADRYILEMAHDLGHLGCEPPDVEPKVSTHIPVIQEMVERLIARGHAYVADGDVYFAVDSFPAYGKLSGWNLEGARAGERVAIDTRKRNPADFALWKAAKPDEPHWPSPWGDGRPGWHIECSAMAWKHLGEQFDIHGGGKDLTFPHHENEIAQSECTHGHTYVNHWMHVGLVNVDGEKMSKSLGNFWMLRDVLAIHHPQTIRFFLLSAHYRKPIAYSDVNLDHASHRVRYLYRTAQAIAALAASTPLPPPDRATLSAWQTAMYAGMDDDFNTPVALAIVYEVARSANEWLATKKLSKQTQILAQIAAAQAFFEAFATFTGVLSADPTTVLDEMQALLVRQLGIDLAAVETLLAERAEARASKDWARADAAREALLAMHIQVMDTADGTRFFVDPPAPDAPQQLELDESANDHQSLT